MQDTEQTKQHLHKLLASQKLAVLSTNDRGQAYANLIGFAVTGDLKFLLFSTNRQTRKYQNIMRNNSVALLIDNRSVVDKDFQNTMAVTVTGAAEEVPLLEREKWLKLYLAKHPHMTDFANAPDCALIRVRAEWYYLVSKFQQVAALPMDV